LIISEVSFTSLAVPGRHPRNDGVYYVAAITCKADTWRQFMKSTAVIFMWGLYRFITDKLCPCNERHTETH